jgi:hypothetical protein
VAIIDLNYDIDRFTIWFERKLPDECWDAKEVLFYACDDKGEAMYVQIPVQFKGLDEGPRFIPKAFPEKILALVMSSYGEARVGFFIDNEFRHAEVITFTPKVLKASVDPLRLNTRRVQLPQKAARVAVFTQAYNEGAMLHYWEQYYGRMVGFENLYVLDNASTDGSCQKLNPRTSVIHMPQTPVDHEHFAQVQGYFQRFLLLKYDWVIKVDTDELLSCEGGLVERLAKTPPGTYRPETAVEVVHDTQGEPPFDFNGPVGRQRKHFVQGTKLLIRPIISSQPTTWTAGNHLGHELSVVMDGLIVSHLKYFDLDFLLSKNKRWATMVPTENERKVCGMIGELEKLGLQDLVDLSVSDIAQRLADPALTLPEWYAESI